MFSLYSFIEKLNRALNRQNWKLNENWTLYNNNKEESAITSWLTKSVVSNLHQFISVQFVWCFYSKWMNLWWPVYHVDCCVNTHTHSSRNNTHKVRKFLSKPSRSRPVRLVIRYARLGWDFVWCVLNGFKWQLSELWAISGCSHLQSQLSHCQKMKLFFPCNSKFGLNAIICN